MAGNAKSLARQQIHCRYNMVKIWQRRYAHMKARQEGRATHQSSGALGKPICTYEEFEAWCIDFTNLQEFLTLYFEWALNGFNRWDSPSIDRKDPKKGYTVDNLQWLSFSDNCIKNNKDPIDHRVMSSG
jgi:hypothetical protein